MAVPAPYLKAIFKYAPLVEPVARRYGINGRQLLARLAQGESHFNMGAVSSAGARGGTQFMPGTRAQYIRQYGIDPWRSPDEAIHATAIYLRHSHGLAGYNPGDPSYTNYILGQRVGNLAAQFRGAGGSPGNYSAPSPVTQPGGTGLADLISSLQQQQSKPAGSIIQAPQFTSSRYFTQVQPGMPKPSDQQGSLSDLLASIGPSSAPRAPSGAGGTPESVGRLANIFSRAARINSEHLPYQWGGGHGPTPAKPGVPLDCSGAVSRVLGIPPRVSGQFESFGAPGRGQHVTIYANGHHVLMEINGHFWGTSATNPGGGAGWIPRGAISPGYLKGFVARHPPGM